MMKNNLRKKYKGGFLELIVIVLVALILLKFLNIDINSFLAKDWVREFLAYTKEMLVMIWQDLVSIFFAIKNS